jgi:hypothetical protein
MKEADFLGPAAVTLPTPTNGTHRKKQGDRAAKGKSAAANAALLANESFGAPFAPIHADASDTPMWPIHTSIWFQPDLAPAPPSWTGLAIERRHRIPTPGFLWTEADPLNRPCLPDDLSSAMRSESAVHVPASELEPLGWDPRAIVRKGEQE